MSSRRRERLLGGGSVFYEVGASSRRWERLLRGGRVF